MSPLGASSILRGPRRIGGENRHREARWQFHLGTGGPGYQARRLGRRRRVEGRGQRGQVDAVSPVGYIVLPVVKALDGLVRAWRRGRWCAGTAGWAARKGGDGLERAVLHGLKVGNQIATIGVIGYRYDHGRTWHDTGRRGQEAVQRSGIPGEAGRLQRGRITELCARGMTPEHPVQVGTLGPTAVTGFRAVAQRALGAEYDLAGGGIGTKHRCSAHHRGQHRCRRH